MSDVEQHLQKGLARLEESNIHLASLHFRAVLSTYPKHPIANALLGELALRHSQYSDAVQCFEIALRALGDNVDLLNNLGMAYQSLGQFEKSKEMYMRGLLIEPDHSILLSNYGNLLAENNAFQEALSIYEKALILNDDIPELWCNYGRSLAELGKDKNAKTAFEKALSKNKFYPGAHVELARLYTKQKQFNVALQHYGYAMKNNESDVLVHDEMAQLHLMMNDTLKAAIALSNHGAALMDMGQTEEAVRVLLHSIALHPNLHAAYSNLSCAYLKLENWKDALAFAQRALEFNANDANSLNNGIVALLALNRHFDALSLANRAIKQHSENVDIQLAMGRIRLELKDDKALLNFETALRLDPNRSETNHLIGLFYLTQENWSVSNAYLQKAFQFDSQSALICDDLAMSFHGMERYLDALKCHEKAIAIDDTNGSAYTHMGLTLSKLGHVHAALLCHSKALEMNGAKAPIFNNMGNVFREMGAIDDAFGAYQSAIEANPKMWEAHINLGNALKELGRFVLAESAYKKAISINQHAMRAYRQLSILNRFEPNEEELNQWEALYESSTGSSSKKAHLAFALGRLYEEKQNNKASFHYYSLGNAQKRSEYEHNEAKHEALVDRIIETFSSEYFQKKTPGSDSRRPIFIVGLPRSGTTLVEQILSSHSDVTAAGEQSWLPDTIHALHSTVISDMAFPELYLNLPSEMWTPLANAYLLNHVGYDGKYITDKLPNNTLRIGVIQKLFPSAVVIHVRRDPVETGFSIFKQYFSGNQPFAYDLNEIAQHILSHYKLMEHWDTVLPSRVHHISYEELVANPFDVIAEMLSVCHLEWEDKCLRFYDNPRRVQTASLQQVREPLYKSSVQKSRQFETQLNAFRNHLAQLR